MNRQFNKPKAAGSDECHRALGFIETDTLDRENIVAEYEGES